MAIQSNNKLCNVLQTLIPISNLSKDNIERLALSSSLNSVGADNIIFTEGNSDNFAFYLVEGELELVSTNNSNFHVFAGTDDARYPLAQFQPRQYTARTIEDSLILCIDKTLLDTLLVSNQAENIEYTSGLEVSDIGNDQDDDWMTRILQSPLYTNISVEDIQSIFSKIESIDVSKGDIIVRQGDNADYYYIIQTGLCQISRRPSPGAQDINLAQIREGDAFGEEAIIANTKRNASVRMLTDGRLMRLSKDDFIELILKSILQKVDLETAQAIEANGAIWLDVRYPDEYQDYSIEKSINIPLNLLRLQVGKLDKAKQYITCCDTGSRCSIAAFILAQHGYQVYLLENGLKDLFRQVDKDQVEIITSSKTSSAEILPFTKSNLGEDIETDSEVYDEIQQLRQELEGVREQFQELLSIKDIASEIKKSVLDLTDKKLKEQKDHINQQTQNANKLIKHAQKMHKDIDEEKQMIYKEVEIQRRKQEETMSNMHAEIKKRFLEEEKKMQAFYSWKANEIEKINKLKQVAEERLQERISERETQSDIENNDSGSEILKPVFPIIEKDKVSQQEQSQEALMNEDLKEWLSDELENELSPLNKEIKRVKSKIIKEADERLEKTKQLSKIHDQRLSAELDGLLRNIDK